MRQIALVLSLALAGVCASAMATNGQRTVADASDTVSVMTTALHKGAAVHHRPLFVLKYVLTLSAVPPRQPRIDLDGNQQGIVPPDSFTHGSVLLRDAPWYNPNDSGCRQYQGFLCVTR